MATADEILAAEFGNDDAWLEIDLASRQIIIPKSITNLGVKSDADVMHVRFKLPRFYYGVDFSEFKIGIDYMNAEGGEDRYEPKDVTVSANVITFTWIVGRNATVLNGNVTFGLCAKRLNPADPDDPFNEFHTTKASLPILDGMETCEEAVIMHTDLLEQWRAQLFGEKDSLIADINTASQNEQNAIQEKGVEVLATIPEDYAETFSMINHADRTKADAILCSAEGDAISIADASDDHVRNLRVFGKSTQVQTTGKNLADPNLLPYGFASNVEMGPVIGENATEYRTLIALVSPGQVYTVSRGAVLGSRFRYGFTVEYPSAAMPIHNSETAYAGTYDASRTFTTIPVPEGYNYLLVYLTNINSTEHVENTWYQVELGTEATAYEPYSGGKPAPSPEYPQELVFVDQPNVSVFGKNLLDLTKCSFGYCTHNDGVLTSAIEDYYYASIHCPAFFNDYLLKNRGKTITFSADSCVEGSCMAMVINGTRANGSTYQESKGTIGERSVSITIADDFETIAQLMLRWNRQGTKITDNTSTISNIQLELGPTATEYEPYKPVQTIAIPYSLRAIPVAEGGNYTDTNGQQWICDEVDLASGVYVQRVAECALNGTENWTIDSASGDYTRHCLALNPKAVLSIPGLCTHYPYKYDYYDQSNHFYCGSSLYIFNDVQTTDEFKSYLSAQYSAGTPVTVHYVLATPIETPLTASEIEAFKALSTNFPNTTVMNDASAWMEFVYNADTRTYLDRLPKATDVQVQKFVDVWLEQHFQSAEGVSF